MMAEDGLAWLVGYARRLPALIPNVLEWEAGGEGGDRGSLGGTC